MNPALALRRVAIDLLAAVIVAGWVTMLVLLWPRVSQEAEARTRAEDDDVPGPPMPQVNVSKTWRAQA